MNQKHVIGEGYQSDDENSSNSSQTSSQIEQDNESDNNYKIDEEGLEDIQDGSFYSDKDESGDQILLDSTNDYDINSQNINVPPPNPILRKQFAPDEPVRSGFAMKLMQAIMIFQLIEREVIKPQKQEDVRELQGPILESIKQPSNNHINTVLNQMQQQHDEQSNINQETSLRHFFYLEYRKPTLVGEKNPIVYSRFGKQSYDSEERFCPDSFSQLIRTCNLKRLIRGLPGDVNTKTSISQQINEQSKTKKSKSHQQQQILKSYYSQKNQFDNTLIFESRFESGNLQLAHKVCDTEYNLILQNDINSKGHTQWFYFSIQNTKKNLKVKFNLLNFIKTKSLFNEGMKVLIYSKKHHEQQQKGWQRGGEDISYYPNNFRREHMLNYQRCYYTLSFTYKFEYDDDTVLFAYSQPYTYSDLTDEIQAIERKNLDYVTRNTMCRTLAGNKCEYLTITSRRNGPPSEYQHQKKGVVISGRVHPGEANASWMMKGVIDFLTGDSQEAQILRNNFVFKIIPMLNPDGVINGNYRCSLAGCDLNRRWKYPSQTLHPTIFHAKKLIKEFARERPMALFCDLHGHSRRKNTFIYGNVDPTCPEATRIFPYLLSKIASKHFSYDFCRFKVQKSKDSTARIALWKDIKIPNIFTMEASFCGPKPVFNEETKVFEQNYHYTSNDLMDLGKNLCQTLLLYCGNELNLNNQIQELKTYHQRKVSQTITNTAIVKQNETTKAFDKTKKEFKEDKVIQIQPQLTINEEKEEDEEEIDIFNIKIDQNEMIKEIEKKIKIEKLTRTIRKQDDETSSGSDSEVSEDNLDAGDLAKLMPKRSTKRKIGGRRRKNNSHGILNSQKPIMKIEQEYGNRKECPVYAEVKKKNTNRVSDFKKPTQSFLSKYKLYINKHHSKGPQMRDAHCQTSDYEDDDNYELSAMEKDIFISTGSLPRRFNKLLNKTEVVPTREALSPIKKDYNMCNSKKENVQVLVSKQAYMESFDHQEQKALYNSDYKSKKSYEMQNVLEDKTNKFMSGNSFDIPRFNNNAISFQERQLFENNRIKSISSFNQTSNKHPLIGALYRGNSTTDKIHHGEQLNNENSKQNVIECHSQSIGQENEQLSARAKREQQQQIEQQMKQGILLQVGYRRKSKLKFKPSSKARQSIQTLHHQQNSTQSGDDQQRICLPYMINNGANQSQQQNLSKQISPILQITHNRLQNCGKKLNENYPLLEKIEEKPLRSQSMNQYNSRTHMVQKMMKGQDIQENYSFKNSVVLSKEESFSQRMNKQSQGHVGIGPLLKKQRESLREANNIINLLTGSAMMKPK